MKNIYKKLIILGFILLNFSAIANVMPYYTNSLARFGIGFTSVSSPLVLRKEPAKNSPIIESLIFDYQGGATCSVNKARCTYETIFAANSKKREIALMTTLDESEKDKTNWALVCFNQAKNPVCGWVEENEKNKFYNWTDFFNIYGKKYGIYLFKDLPKNDRLLYANPTKQTNSTGSIKMPLLIMPWLVRGNWVLVKVIDFNNEKKTGWLNFRDDMGRLKVFINF